MEDEEILLDTLFNPGHRGNVDRKVFLERQKIINCGYCPYHRGENDTRRKRNPHDKRIPWKDGGKCNVSNDSV